MQKIWEKMQKTGQKYFNEKKFIKTGQQAKILASYWMDAHNFLDSL